MDVSREPKNQSAADLAQFAQVQEVFAGAGGSIVDRIDGFPKFASRQSLAKFLARYEIFKKILGIHGSIVECGVLHGAGLFTFAKLSSILEPVNHTRRVIGFDTFSGFPEIDARDRTGSGTLTERGALAGSSADEIRRAIALYDLNRPLAHIPKIELVEGDLCETAPSYVKARPHLVISLLYLDLDLYLPTKVAIEAFRPRMPKGAIIVFDELNAEIFPGETAAVHEMLGLGNLRIERFSFDSYLSYCVID
jgi:hypothetical protein